MAQHNLIGIGLRHPHYKQVLQDQPDIGWLEVHSENFFHSAGPSIDFITSVRKKYPISLHGIGLSLGSADGLNQEHLAKLKGLVDRLDPFLVSEHLSWGYLDGIYIPDLLPVPYNQESFDVFAKNITTTQEFLGREILIENPSTYIEYKASKQHEVDFMTSLCAATGAKLLLDINNVSVSCFNHGWDVKEYINAIPIGLVKEIHLAGHSSEEIAPGKILRIDTHDRNVCPEVWDLYGHAISRFGLIPTLIEWDSKIPNLEFLLKEASKIAEYFTGWPHAKA